MAAGERELFKTFEEVTTKNLRTLQDYTTATRALIRENEETVKELKNMVVSQNDRIQQLQTQIATLLAKQYQGGS
jgi:DNA mismatch repair ATPase MutS